MSELIVFLKSVPTFVGCIPALIKLWNTLQAAAVEAETKRKVKDDILTIHGAFSEKDPAKLNKLFSSQ
jgi:hypothetical protein